MHEELASKPVEFHLRGNRCRGIMPLFDGYDPASETPWHPRILPETTSDAVHRDTCSPYHSLQPIITVLCFAQRNSLRSSAMSTSDLPNSSWTYTCFLSDWISIQVSIPVPLAALIAARYDLTTTRGCATAWGDIVSIDTHV